MVVIMKLLLYTELGFCYIGAAMSLKSVFSTPFQARLAAYNSKLTWADSSCSDCIAFLNAYRVCIMQKSHFIISMNKGTLMHGKLACTRNLEHSETILRNKVS
jgi:hypothetical protein